MVFSQGKGTERDCILDQHHLFNAANSFLFYIHPEGRIAGAIQSRRFV